MFFPPFVPLLVALSLLLVPATGFAQENAWSVGFKGGSTFSSVAGTQRAITNDRVSTRLIVGYTGGLSVQYLTEKNFGLQVEFNYTQKGWRQAAPETAPDRRYRVDLDYAEVPILAHGYFGNKNTRIFLNAGVYLAHLLSSDTDRANIEDGDVNYLYQERFQNPFDFGSAGRRGV